MALLDGHLLALLVVAVAVALLLVGGVALLVVLGLIRGLVVSLAGLRGQKLRLSLDITAQLMGCHLTCS